jgi:SAM-dependent methyltransferase
LTGLPKPPGDMLHPECPICAGTSNPAFIAGEHRMFRCRVCHSAFLHPMPTPAWLEDFYRRFHLPQEEGGTYDEAEARVAADFPAKIAMIHKAVGKRPLRLLDVGCGKGFFVKACREAGIDAEGIDLSEAAVSFACDHLGVPAHWGRIEEVDAQHGSFDVVTLWATIEHLPSPLATLGAIRSVLPPGGWLFLDTGTGHDLLDRLLPGVTQWYDPPQHVFVFSPSGIRCLLTAAGFDIVRLDPCFERSRVRRLARFTRGLAAASVLRIVAGVLRLSSGQFRLTRFPLGNLTSVVCRRSHRPRSPRALSIGP